jgi:NADH-quinone oxidoreductase subunit L
MASFIHVFILIPFLGFIISLLCPPKNETLISRVAFVTVGLHFVSSLGFSLYWIFNAAPTLDLKDFVLFKSAGYEFFIDFCFDKITAVYLLVGSFLSFLVTIYSRAYLHRETGYKRFFNTILFFYLGYNVVVFSGNFETLFVGWEVLGISSFLLIAFYRDRYLPVKNAIKVFSVYRIGDVGLILAMWASHHLWHENITFLKLRNYELVHEHLQNHSWVGIFISIMILLAAAAKSAQLPFSAWLPRAMEGPTPSSAIFYGSLPDVTYFAFLGRANFYQNPHVCYGAFYEYHRNVDCAGAVVGKESGSVCFYCANWLDFYRSIFWLGKHCAVALCRKCVSENVSTLGFAFGSKLFNP